MRKILLTRLVEDNVEDKKYFEALGYCCVEQPLLRLSVNQPSPQLIMDMGRGDWIFLTSQHSASFFFILFSAYYSSSELQKKRFAVIGEKTAAVVTAAGLIPHFQSSKATKSGLFSEWLEQHPEPVTIFYPKSSLADCLGEESFPLNGHQLLTGIIYDNQFTDEQKKGLEEQLKEKSLAAVYLTSPSLWHRFYSVYRGQEVKSPLEFYCVGETTRQAIQRSGYDAVIT